MPGRLLTPFASSRGPAAAFGRRRWVSTATDYPAPDSLTEPYLDIVLTRFNDVVASRLGRLAVRVIRVLTVIENRLQRGQVARPRVEPGIDVLSADVDDRAVMSRGSDFRLRLVGDRGER